MIEYGYEWSWIYKQTLHTLDHMFKCSLQSLRLVWLQFSIRPPGLDSHGQAAAGTPAKNPESHMIIYQYDSVWQSNMMINDTHIWYSYYTPCSAAWCCLWAFASNASRHVHFGPSSVASGKSYMGILHGMVAQCAAGVPVRNPLCLSLTDLVYIVYWEGFAESQNSCHHEGAIQGNRTADIYLEQTCM